MIRVRNLLPHSWAYSVALSTLSNYVVAVSHEKAGAPKPFFSARNRVPGYSRLSNIWSLICIPIVFSQTAMSGLTYAWPRLFRMG